MAQLDVQYGSDLKIDVLSTYCNAQCVSCRFVPFENSINKSLYVLISFKGQAMGVAQHHDAVR